jgi:hypothetical protein
MYLQVKLDLVIPKDFLVKLALIVVIVDIDVVIVNAHIVVIQIHVENNVVEDMSY